MAYSPLNLQTGDRVNVRGDQNTYIVGTVGRPGYCDHGVVHVSLEGAPHAYRRVAIEAITPAS